MLERVEEYREGTMRNLSTPMMMFLIMYMSQMLRVDDRHIRYDIMLSSKLDLL